MVKKQLKFCVNQLIIGGQKFDHSDFARLNEEDLEKHDITHREDKEVETLAIKKYQSGVLMTDLLLSISIKDRNTLIRKL